MSLWLEILNEVSIGNSSEAYRLLNFELPQRLRWAEVRREGEWQYTGLVPKIVRIFIASLPEADRGMARSRADDFVDYITDVFVAKVRRTASLLEFCSTHPNLTIEQLADDFKGWDGLKLGKEARARWIAKHLRSMNAAGIELNSKATEAAEKYISNEDELYGYHEFALLKKWRADLSWKDFKAQEELDSSYVSMIDAGLDEAPSVEDEAFDYGAITAARVVLNLNPPTGKELALDLNRLGEQLTLDLLELLEEFHAEKPCDGYFPIAWHNVWWTIVYKYDAVPFDLNEREPHCDVDRTLSDYIERTYTTVLKPSRLNVQRRRTKLQNKCVEHTQAVLLAWNETGS